MRYDLHSHTLVSDGSLSPEALVDHAHEHGVNVLALTDHDTTDGVIAAQRQAQRLGMTLVPGVEVSVTWNGQTVHILGLNVDIANPQLQQGLQGLRAFRDWRAMEIGRRLEQHGITDAYAGAKALAKGVLIGRTHFARFLVQAGHAKDLKDVFKRFLIKSKPGHVTGDWTRLEQAVAWITGAGGQALIAHPARYKLTATKLRRLIEDFKQAGGIGIEVVSGSHSKNDCETMAGLARRYDLYASRGSDYHGPENPWNSFSSLPPLPTSCAAIWESEDWLRSQADTGD